MQRKLSTSSPDPTGGPGQGPVDHATLGQVATPRFVIDRAAERAAPPAVVPGVSTHWPEALN